MTGTLGMKRGYFVYPTRLYEWGFICLDIRSRIMSSPEVLGDQT